MKRRIYGYAKRSNWTVYAGLELSEWENGMSTEGLHGNRRKCQGRRMFD